MPWLLNIVYLAAIILLAPWLAWRMLTTGRYRRGVSAKLLGTGRILNANQGSTAWFHAVSVGEVNLLGTLIPPFRQRHPDWRIVVSSTTDTGLAECRRRFPDLEVIAWPFDFSWAVGRTLTAVQPSLVVLTESELWPNFLSAAQRKKIPVIVVNARMSPRSFRRISRFAGLARRLLFAPIHRFAVQEEEYAERMRALGISSNRIVVTGSIKYDGAYRDRDTAAGRALGHLLGLNNTTADRPLVWLAGSTHAPEEEIVLGVFARLKTRFPALRLILVPRHPDRFEEVASLVEQADLSSCRRSRITMPLASMPEVVLLDSVGELGAAWGLADIGFTGGSLDGHRGGQSMIEPAGLGVPTVFGPHVWNFKDAARRLVEVNGARVVNDDNDLEQQMADLLADEVARRRMGEAARELVRRQQGATLKTLNLLDEVIGVVPTRQAA